MTVAPEAVDVDPRLLARHEAARGELSSSLGGAPAAAGFALLALQGRLDVEANARLGEVAADQLLPPPRAFLSPAQERRLAGARAMDEHLLRRRGGVDHATPLVLHALATAATGSPEAGLLRRIEVGWRGDAASHAAPAAEVAERYEAAITTVLASPAPPIVRAPWLTATLLSIHPFTDGNGRVARAVHTALAGDAAIPGTVEQWSRQRAGYLTALRAGGRADGYDPSAFVRFSLEAGIIAAERLQRRLAVLGEVSRWLGERASLSLLARVAALTLWCDRFSPLGGAFADELVDELVEAGVAERVATPPSRASVVWLDAVPRAGVRWRLAGAPPPP